MCPQNIFNKNVLLPTVTGRCDSLTSGQSKYYSIYSIKVITGYKFNNVRFALTFLKLYSHIFYHMSSVTGIGSRFTATLTENKVVTEDE